MFSGGRVRTNGAENKWVNYQSCAILNSSLRKITSKLPGYHGAYSEKNCFSQSKWRSLLDSSPNSIFLYVLSARPSMLLYFEQCQSSAVTISINNNNNNINNNNVLKPTTKFFLKKLKELCGMVFWNTSVFEMHVLLKRNCSFNFHQRPAPQL